MLIFGLGNPGPQYAVTRHNVGFIILDFLAEKWGIPFSDYKLFSVAQGKRATLIKPQTFMNSSGPVIRSLVEQYGKDFLIICDDADLPSNRIRLRARGSSGGHKGLESIIDALGTEDFKRLRIGISKPDDTDLSDHVLSAFTDEELKNLSPTIDKVIAGIEILIDHGLLKAQEYLNKE